MQETQKDECPYCHIERRQFGTAEAWKTHVQQCFDGMETGQPRKTKGKIERSNREVYI